MSESFSTFASRKRNELTDLVTRNTVRPYRVYRATVSAKLSRRYKFHSFLKFRNLCLIELSMIGWRLLRGLGTNLKTASWADVIMSNPSVKIWLQVDFRVKMAR